MMPADPCFAVMPHSTKVVNKRQITKFHVNLVIPFTKFAMNLVISFTGFHVESVIRPAVAWRLPMAEPGAEVMADGTLEPCRRHSGRPDVRDEAAGLALPESKANNLNE